MDDFTPTTVQVRDGYRFDPEDEYRDPINAPFRAKENGRAFDRWLKRVKAEAWDEGWLAAPGEFAIYEGDNPYREQEKFLKDLRD